MEGREFLWAVGIEDSFIAEPSPRTGRNMEEYELTQHYRFWREDLDLAASLGVRTMRYGIPWYRVNPKPGCFDWTWTDEVLEYMERLHIRPIVDLVHYGCPLWMEGAFTNPRYPERVAEYAREFAERYPSLTHYTPLNEPLVCARYCGYTGYWPPYLRGWRGYTQVLLSLVEGMAATIRALRTAQPNVVIVHVEAASSFRAAEPTVVAQVEQRELLQFLPTDLLLGRVEPSHPLYSWLLNHGAEAHRLDQLAQRAQDIDVMGVNFYPHISCWELVGVGGGVKSRQFYGTGEDLEAVLRTWHERFGKPLMVTETSGGNSMRRRERWLSESVAAVQRAVAAGLPVVGYTWWPLFSLVSWTYEYGKKPLEEYMVDMGLWDLQSEDGELRRVSTPLVARYRQLVEGRAK